MVFVTLEAFGSRDVGMCSLANAEHGCGRLYLSPFPWFTILCSLCFWAEKLDARREIQRRCNTKRGHASPLSWEEIFFSIYQFLSLSFPKIVFASGVLTEWKENKITVLKKSISLVILYKKGLSGNHLVSTLWHFWKVVCPLAVKQEKPSHTLIQTGSLSPSLQLKKKKKIKRKTGRRKDKNIFTGDFPVKMFSDMCCGLGWHGWYQNPISSAWIR